MEASVDLVGQGLGLGLGPVEEGPLLSPSDHSLPLDHLLLVWHSYTHNHSINSPFAPAPHLSQTSSTKDLQVEAQGQE